MELKPPFIQEYTIEVSEKSNSFFNSGLQKQIFMGKNTKVMCNVKLGNLYFIE
jgi:hypothetical protein